MQPTSIMNPQQSDLTTVLETLLGDNPFNGDYPTDLIVSPLKDRTGRIRCVHFALYGEDDDDSATFRGELRNPRIEGGILKLRASARTSLSIRRPGDYMGVGINSPRILDAFTAIARQELAKHRENMNSRKEER